MSGNIISSFTLLLMTSYLIILTDADTNTRYQANYTPLRWSASRDNPRSVQHPVQAKSNSNAEEQSGRRFQNLARDFKNIETKKDSLIEGSNSNSEGYFNFAPLPLTANSVGPSLSSLPEKDSKVEEKADNARSFLNWEEGKNSLKIFKMPAEEDINTKVRLRRSNDPLSVRPQRGSVSFADLERNAGRNLRYSPVQWTNDWNEEAVRELLNSGGNIEARDKFGRTALGWAAAKNNVKIVRELLNRGADINARDNTNYTPLHWATYKGNADSLRVLVEAGADIEAKDNSGRTPLSWSAQYNEPNSVRILVAKGADKNSKDNRGYTPLHWTTEKNKIEAMRELLSAGVDVNAKDNKGWTSLRWAKHYHNEEAIDALIGAGAKEE